MITEESSISLNNLKCILCICVVMIHCQISPASWADIVHMCTGGSFLVFAIIQKIIIDLFLDNTCVPVFFLLSGYFFFLKYNETYLPDDYDIQ